MRTATLTNFACLGICLLSFVATPVRALTEVSIGPISAHMPDTDGFLDGDSDCYIEVRVDGTLVGVTPVIDGNNNPSWPAIVFTYQYLPPNSPFLTVEFKVYDDDSPLDEYQGVALVAYNWLAGNPVAAYTTSVNSPFGAGYTITAGFDANEVAVPVEGETWGSIKALYR